MALITQKRTSEFSWDNFFSFSLMVGDEITDQLNNGKNIKFVVLDVNCGLTTIGVLDYPFDCCMNNRVNNDNIDDNSWMSKSSTTNRGGWATSALRKHLNDTVFPLLPKALQDIVLPRDSKDKLWLLSEREVCGESKYGANDGTEQLKYFQDVTHRQRKSWWWTRTPQEHSSTNFVVVSEQGEPSFCMASVFGGVCFAFYI